MRTHFILILLIILPILASAQFNSNQAQIQQARAMNQQMNAQNQKWASERAKGDQQWFMQTMMNRSMNKNIATVDKKVTNEEKIKKKLEEKTTKLNSDLKTQQDKLTALENSGNSTDNDTQKNIEKAKQNQK